MGKRSLIILLEKMSTNASIKPLPCMGDSVKVTANINPVIRQMMNGIVFFIRNNIMGMQL